MYAMNQDEETRWLRKVAISAVVAWAVVTTIAAVALGVSKINDDTALRRASTALSTADRNYALILKQQQRLDNTVLHGCIRLNILRAQSNASNWVDYQYITQQIRFTSSSLHSNFLALQQVGISPKVLRRALRQSLAALQTQRAQAATKAWVPLTNCTAVALSSGGSYSPPEAVSFSHGPPPKSVLSAKNASLPDPQGSLPPD